MTSENEAMAELMQSKSYWERNRLSEGYLMKKSIKAIVIKICRAILLFGMCFLILQPIIGKLCVSLMAEEDLYNSMVIYVPENFTLANYQLAADFMSYGESLKNTIIISFTTAALQIFMCMLVGYGFARFNFHIKKFLFACVILVIIIPPQTISTSLYLHFRYFDIAGIFKSLTGSSINLRDSVLPYYLMSAGCMGLKSGLYIFMMRQFFRNIPKELEEAAYVDGCGIFRTFISIMLPDAKPIITSCFLFSFVWQWTDIFYTKTFLGNIKLLSRQLSMIGDRLDAYVKMTLGDAGGASVGYTNCIVSTGTLMVIAPLLILYLFAQKGFVESISNTGIKM